MKERLWDVIAIFTGHVSSGFALKNISEKAVGLATDSVGNSMEDSSLRKRGRPAIPFLMNLMDPAKADILKGFQAALSQAEEDRFSLALVRLITSLEARFSECYGIQKQQIDQEIADFLNKISSSEDDLRHWWKVLDENPADKWIERLKKVNDSIEGSVSLNRANMWLENRRKQTLKNI